jgi:signal transduction histidine kinase
MDESYSDRGAAGTAHPTQIPSIVAESEPQLAFARDLLAQLLPGADSHLLIRALLAERLPSASETAEAGRYDSDEELAQRELRRVRAQLDLGEAARTLQHAFNNPLTALLAEAQLLELETLPDDHRSSVRRILELARRLVAISRRLGTVGGGPTIG